MQGLKGKCKDEKENARTTQKAIPWIAACKSSDQKLIIFWVIFFTFQAFCVKIKSKLT